MILGLPQSRRPERTRVLRHLSPPSPPTAASARVAERRRRRARAPIGRCASRHARRSSVVHPSLEGRLWECLAPPRLNSPLLAPASPHPCLVSTPTASPRLATLRLTPASPRLASPLPRLRLAAVPHLASPRPRLASPPPRLATASPDLASPRLPRLAWPPASTRPASQPPCLATGGASRGESRLEPSQPPPRLAIASPLLASPSSPPPRVAPASPRLASLGPAPPRIATTTASPRLAPPRHRLASPCLAPASHHPRLASPHLHPRLIPASPRLASPCPHLASPRPAPAAPRLASPRSQLACPLASPPFGPEFASFGHILAQLLSSTVGSCQYRAQRGPNRATRGQLWPIWSASANFGKSWPDVVKFFGRSRQTTRAALGQILSSMFSFSHVRATSGRSWPHSGGTRPHSAKRLSDLGSRRFDIASTMRTKWVRVRTKHVAASGHIAETMTMSSEHSAGHLKWLTFPCATLPGRRRWWSGLVSCFTTSGRHLGIGCHAPNSRTPVPLHPTPGPRPPPHLAGVAEVLWSLIGGRRGRPDRPLKAVRTVCAVLPLGDDHVRTCLAATRRWFVCLARPSAKPEAAQGGALVHSKLSS